MKYVDTHCHLDFPDYEADMAEVLKRMNLYDISAITIGTDLESSKKAIEIAEANENIWACIGVHPGVCNKPERAVFDEAEFEKLVVSRKVVGIGECGLEYFHLKKEDTGDLQKKLLEDQIKFAIKHDKPLMLHIRNAYDDALEILNNFKKESGEKLRGNYHFFAGDVEIAKKFLDIGFTMSFTGVITFTNFYDEVIKFIPVDSIMSETDAPFVAPVPHRGKRNEPAFVVEIVKRLAELKNVSMEEMVLQIRQTAQKTFGIS